MGLSKEFREAQMCRLRDIENQNKYDEFICKFDDYQRNAGKGSGELSVREDLENNFDIYPYLKLDPQSHKNSRPAKMFPINLE